MEHAWLDSLSEDWVSQPGSDSSGAQLPPLKDVDSKTKAQPRSSPSRILRRAEVADSSLILSKDSPINILSERSASDNNVPRSRMPSKLSYELKDRSITHDPRSVSASTNGSVVRNTVQHRASPKRNGASTPEWRRRLIQGNMPYGEQRDLFCSAAAGLQDMFKPPPETEFAPGDEEWELEATIPSSPPFAPPSYEPDFADLIDEIDDEEFEHPEQVTPSPSPRKPHRQIKYKLNVDSSSPMRPDQTPSYNKSTRIHRDESCLSAPAEDEDVSRKTSGQSCVHNEDFSPILIQKHSDEDGVVDFAPVEVTAGELQKRLERLRVNQMLLDSKRDQDAGPVQQPERIEGTIDNTADFARNGGFVNFRRGGRSAEGSFRYRGLSPSLGGDTSEMLPEESLQASTPKQFPTVRTELSDGRLEMRSPVLPRAPFPSPEKPQAIGKAFLHPGGSPLKLFGPYDTFTNQTLLRRISQFEEGTSGSTSLDPISGEASPSHANQAFVEPSSPRKPERLEHADDSSRSVSHFGAGDLEGYEFRGDISVSPSEESCFVGDKENIVPVAFETVQSYGLQSRRIGSPGLEESEIQVRRRRERSSSSSAKHARQSSTSNMRSSINPPRGAPSIALGETPKRDGGSDGKRPRTSPSKDPTPKRRRTLHRSDIAYGRDQHMAVVDSAHYKLQYLMGKKRKDARPGDFELADPDVLALRSILRPRSPTPNQRSLRRHDRTVFEGQPQLFFDMPLTADENMPLSSDSLGETERKPSIRTQDFVDQAAQIMAMIRSQVKPPGLASLEESEAEQAGPSPVAQEDSYQSSTKEPFSRPPSREGAPISRVSQMQEDPELVQKLKKYQELSDMGDVISSSLRSVSLARDAIRAAQEVERQIHERSRARQETPLMVEGDVESDLANVRLSTNPALGVDARSPARDFPSNSSNNSHPSYPTASSRGSDSRKVIMPESVSHLIPERVGTMCLDKTNNIWVRKREEGRRSGGNVAPSDDSEEDPFASIPDLTVDVTQEMHNLRIATALKNVGVSGNDDQPERQGNVVHNPPNRGFVTFSPTDHLGPETAALTRYEFQKLDSCTSPNNLSSQEEDVGHDSSGHEDMIPTKVAPRKRNMTISFSSPVASIIQDAMAEELDVLDDLDDDPDLQEMLEVARETSSRPLNPKSSRKPALKDGSRGSMRGAAHQVSSRGPGFVRRPVSRIDEQDEDSTVELPPNEQRQISIIGDTSVVSHQTADACNASLGLMFNRTPASRTFSTHASDSAIIGQNVGKLSLSPLSEFTLNNSDQSFGFEVSYVMGHRHMATGDGSKRVMSMTIRELVDKLSEVEPCEPYWEDITDLNLHDKRLTSLHMLDEFCGKIITLDASQNSLAHLDGVPHCVRQLKVSQNLLTELTSWDHLMNLQYVDVSDNELKSLSALKGLVHLRSIKADNNQLTDLDGLDCHDGLLTLRARNNAIEYLDFANVQLDRLTELDVEGNQISTVRNLDLLPALSRLRLSNNKLEGLTTRKSMLALRQLYIDDNEVESLDISCWPNLQSLHVDRNYINHLSGFQIARRLDSLSLREQRCDDLNLGFLSSAYEIRKLFLSGNRLDAFEPQVDFLNLQLLELANCGLRSLPETIGQLMPNLRTLNLNFNAVSDLGPLRFIPRLKKLLVSGNRLMDSTAVTDLLTDFPHLTQLDLRNNPVTLGFYAPFQWLVPADQSKCTDHFVLPDTDVERDEQFARRLDEATKLRRRLHQVVFMASCRRLRKLDGLPLRRPDVLTSDEEYRTLVTEGLLPELRSEDLDLPYGQAPEPSGPEDQQNGSGTLRSSRWQAEDSFA